MRLATQRNQEQGENTRQGEYRSVPDQAAPARRAPAGEPLRAELLVPPVPLEGASRNPRRPRAERAVYARVPLRDG
jgi:hypothetical protein